MSDDNLRRLLGTLDEAADPSPAFRESLYASLAGGLRFGGATAQPAWRFWSGPRSTRLVLILVAIGLALVLAFGFAVLALKPAPQSACVTGDFAAVRAAVAAAPAYDYRITGSVNMFQGSHPETQGPVALGMSGQYRAPDRVALTFDETGQAIEDRPFAGDFPVSAVRWVGSQGYAIYAPMGQREPYLWQPLPDPLLQDATLPDFASRPPMDPISYQLQGSTQAATPIAWSRMADTAAIPSASCAFVATIKPSPLSTQTIRVWLGASGLPIQIQGVRDGYRSNAGESRDQDLVTTISYPIDPAPIAAPSSGEMEPPPSYLNLPPGFTFPPIFPPAEQVIHVGETAVLPDREITAIEVRERSIADDGRAAPPGFVFLQLHLRLHATKDVHSPDLDDYYVSRGGDYYEGHFNLTMTDGPGPSLGTALLVAAGSTRDGWVSTLVPVTGSVRYEISPDMPDGSGLGAPNSVPIVEIVARP